MSKKAGILFVATGAVLILSALLLFAYNRLEDYHAGQEAESMLTKVESYVLEKSPESEATAPTQLDPELPVVIIDGYGYVGYLNIPDLEITLPVMAEWDYDRLRIAPCRQFGSSRTDDLVIAAHNYANHFGRLKTLNPGAIVTFTDMDGIVNEYVLDSQQNLLPTQVEAVQNPDYALVLYTCTPGGETRQAAFFKRNEDCGG